MQRRIVFEIQHLEIQPALLNVGVVAFKTMRFQISIPTGRGRAVSVPRQGKHHRNSQRMRDIQQVKKVFHGHFR